MEAKVKFNKKLLWDYEISEQDLEKEDVFIFYLSRLLNSGSFADISKIPFELIKKYIEQLHLTKRVKKFWEWYLLEK